MSDRYEKKLCIHVHKLNSKGLELLVILMIKCNDICSCELISMLLRFKFNYIALVAFDRLAPKELTRILLVLLF